MHVFVTGGTGLVGSHAIDLLQKSGHTVSALVRDAVGRRLVESLGAAAVFGAVEDPASWTQAQGADAIVHSAAIINARQGWESFQRINIDGARNAAVAAATADTRLVHISSVAVYGRKARIQGHLVDEDTAWAELEAREFYARSKRRAEEVVTEVAQQTGLSFVSLRPCVIYGERDRTFLPHVVRILKHGYAPLIGPGNNSLAVVYAGNVADAILAALNHPESVGPVNVTNDGDVSQREFLSTVGAGLGRKTRFVRVPVPAAYLFTAIRNGLRKVFSPTKYSGFGAAAVRFLSNSNPYSSEKARAELGWRPSTPPVEAIKKSIQWFAGI